MKSKYKTLREWNKSDPKAYKAADRQGLLDEICEMFGWKRDTKAYYWTKERCLKIALTCEKQTDLYKKYNGCLKAIIRNKWDEECFAHMIKRNSWNLEKCIKEASKYKKPIELMVKNKGCYEAIRRNRWQKECYVNMKVQKHSK